MDGMLKRGQVLIARNMQSAAVIEDTLGEGAQAEVYRARIGDAHYALKWYRPEYLAGDQRLWERLKVAINSGTPTEQFLWPFDLVSYPRDHCLRRVPDAHQDARLRQHGRPDAPPGGAFVPGAHHCGLPAGAQFSQAARCRPVLSRHQLWQRILQSLTREIFALRIPTMWM